MKKDEVVKAIASYNKEKAIEKAKKLLNK